VLSAGHPAMENLPDSYTGIITQRVPYTVLVLRGDSILNMILLCQQHPVALCEVQGLIKFERVHDHGSKHC
jgi:hypothetical protein